MKKVITVIILLNVIGNQLSAQEALNNTFYAFNNCVRTLPGAPEMLDDQIKLINELGYDGIAGHHSQDNLVLLKALEKAGLEMPEVYWPVKLLDSGDVSYDGSIHEIIKKASDKDLLVTLVLSTDKYMNHPEQGD